MKLGFVSAILQDSTFDEVIAFAAAEGYDCVEPMCWPLGKAERRYAGVTHIDCAALDAAAVDSISTKLDDRGVRLSGLGYYPNVLSADPAEAEHCLAHLKLVIQAAQKLGVRVVNTFIGRDHTQSVDDNWPRFLEVWRPLVKLAEDCGVTIGIENCPMLFTGDEWPGGKNLAVSPAVWRRIFDDLESEAIGLNYDPSHLVWQQMDYLAPLWEFCSRIVHIHLKDARVDRHRLDQVGVLAHPLEYHSPKLPGLGDIDWGRFFSVLGDTGYAGAVCVEVEDRAYEHSLKGRQEALRQANRYLRQWVPRA